MNNLNLNLNLTKCSNDINTSVDASVSAAVLNNNYGYGDNLLSNEAYKKSLRLVDKKCDKK